MVEKKLIEITVLTALKFVEIEKLDPKGIRTSRREAGLKLLEDGFTKRQVDLLFGDVLGPEAVSAAA